MKTKHLKETNYIIIIFTAIFLLFNTSMALSKSAPITAMYLPAILATSVEREVKKDAGTFKSTGNFSIDYRQAIYGLPPNRFSLKEVVRRYNEMKYDALVCTQVSYYHLGGGPFDKIIINDKLYDVLVIESTPKRWNHGPFLIENTGKCQNWP